MTTKMQFKLCYVSVAIVAALNGDVIAAEATNENIRYDLPGVSQTDFGGVGLLQMPVNLVLAIVTMKNIVAMRFHYNLSIG